MGVMSEIAGTLPEKYLHDNLIFKYLINKNKQFHQFDETAYAFYVIVLFWDMEKVGVSS